MNNRLDISTSLKTFTTQLVIILSWMTINDELETEYTNKQKIIQEESFILYNRCLISGQ